MQKHRQEVPLDCGASRNSSGQRGDVAKCPCGIMKTTGPQTRFRLRARQRNCVLAQVCDGREKRSIKQALVQGANVPFDVIPAGKK
jgi:hypothetical protein